MSLSPSPSPSPSLSRSLALSLSLSPNAFRCVCVCLCVYLCVWNAMNASSRKIISGYFWLFHPFFSADLVPPNQGTPLGRGPRPILEVLRGRSRSGRRCVQLWPWNSCSGRVALLPLGQLDDNGSYTPGKSELICRNILKHDLQDPDSGACHFK